MQRYEDFRTGAVLFCFGLYNNIYIYFKLFQCEMPAVPTPFINLSTGDTKMQTAFISFSKAMLF